MKQERKGESPSLAERRARTLIHERSIFDFSIFC